MQTLYAQLSPDVDGVSSIGGLSIETPIETHTLMPEEIELVGDYRNGKAQQIAAAVAFHRKAIEAALAFHDWCEGNKEFIAGPPTTRFTFLDTLDTRYRDQQMMSALKRILDAAWPDASGEDDV